MASEETYDLLNNVYKTNRHDFKEISSEVETIGTKIVVLKLVYFAADQIAKPNSMLIDRVNINTGVIRTTTEILTASLLADLLFLAMAQGPDLDKTLEDAFKRTHLESLRIGSPTFVNACT